jgi:pyruvate formate lyase activating enzyme
MSAPREALLYEAESDGYLICRLCRHECRIQEGKRGVCRVRENRAGKLYTLVYGRVISQHVDPIEKKPLYHFYPGSTAYSIATAGCNFKCPWCQNWEISQLPNREAAIPGREASPRDVVNAALAYGSRSIAYTYTEPTIFFEYAYDTAQIAEAEGLLNVFITNGYMSEAALDRIGPHLHAANVDLKAFRDPTYKRLIGGRLEPVLENMKLMKAMGIWVEVTTLVIPDLNDDPEELADAADFIAQELGPETPWHISRFYPTYRWTDRPPTSITTLEAAREIGLDRGLRYVYIGNVDGGAGSDTRCPECGELLLRRRGFSVLSNRIRGDHCPNCGRRIEGVGLGGMDLA